MNEAPHAAAGAPKEPAFSRALRISGNLLRKQRTKEMREKRRMDWQRFLAEAECAILSRHRLPEEDLARLVPQPAPLGDPIMEDMCMPPFFTVDPELNDHDDYTALMQLIHARRPRHILELGTAFGNTTANICRLNPDATIHTVNAPLQAQSGEMTTYQLGEQEIGRVYRAAGYGDRVTQIYANTLTMDLSKYLHAPLDVAIIDACHDTPYVINDFEKVLPFMGERGIILLHDTHPVMRRHLYGSYLACVKLRRKGYDIRHVRDTWWGIWQKDWGTAGHESERGAE